MREVARRHFGSDTRGIQAEGLSVFPEQLVGQGIGQISFIAKAIAFVLDLAAAGLFVTFGLYARRKQSWAFIAGIIIYGFDTLFTVLALAWLGVLLHGWAIFSLVVGLKSANQWRRRTRAPKVAATPAVNTPVAKAKPEPLREAA